MRDILCMYYSRTGATRQAMTEIAQALDLALTLIPKDRTVSWGGTVTAAQIGLMDRLHQGDYQLIDRDTGKTPAEKQELMRQALTCGTFIMSSNAISADGQLVNIDGNANRVAALCFGPESVLVIAGMNKVMGDLAVSYTHLTLPTN